MATALQRAMAGQPVKGRQAEGALKKAVSRLESAKRAGAKVKANMASTGSQAMSVMESGGSLFLASLAEGYFGRDKLKVGGVDVRSAVGLVGLAAGFGGLLSGKGWGKHAVAVSEGLVHSHLAGVALDAGRRMASGRSAPQAASSTGEDPSFKVIEGGRPALPDVGADLREILLTDPQSATSGAPSGPPHLVRAHRL